MKEYKIRDIRFQGWPVDSEAIPLPIPLPQEVEHALWTLIHTDLKLGNQLKTLMANWSTNRLTQTEALDDAWPEVVSFLQNKWVSSGNHGANQLYAGKRYLIYPDGVDVPTGALSQGTGGPNTATPVRYIVTLTNPTRVFEVYVSLAVSVLEVPTPTPLPKVQKPRVPKKVAKKNKKRTAFKR